MDAVREWLDATIKERGLNMASLSKAIGKNGTYLQQYIRYGTPAHLPEIPRQRLARELGVSEKQLRAPGLVSSFDPDAPERPHDPDAPANVELFPPDAIKELLTRPGMGGGQTIATTYVRNGETIVQQDPVADDYWRLPPEFVRSILGARPIDLLVMKGNGDSMQPTIMSGEPVIVNTAHRKPSPDGLYAIRDQLGEAVIKRLELFGTNPPRVRIISDNPKHTPQERGLDEIEIVGKVLLGLKLF